MDETRRETSPLELAETLIALRNEMLRHVEEAVAGHGLTLARAKLLGVLVREGPSRPGTIAAALRYAPRTITEAVDGLERGGMVERRPDPTDRRASVVRITERGRAAFEAAEGPKDAAVARLFAALDEGQRRDLLTLARIVLQGLQSGGKAR